MCRSRRRGALRRADAVALVTCHPSSARACVRGTCRGAGYEHQYDGGYEQTHPGKTLVGRAVTAMYMPRRPAMREVMEAKGEAAGQVGDQISWPIDALVKGDCYVADCFGKIAVLFAPPHPAHDSPSVDTCFTLQLPCPI